MYAEVLLKGDYSNGMRYQNTSQQVTTNYKSTTMAKLYHPSHI